jgi:uncharacterized protein (TIGR02757 family)
MNEPLKHLLIHKANLYEQKAFIANDPIVIPHQFTTLQDIEISGFFAAILAWGNRTSIINSSNKLMQFMDHAPHDFILNHQEQDLKKMLHFAHRTFNATDLLYFIYFLHQHYSKHTTLEHAFTNASTYNEPSIERALNQFKNYFFSFDHPHRTRKHIASPQQKSACKRLCMYIRWMVRNEKSGVDFGLWKSIKPNQLICPLDVHVAQVACRLGILSTPQSNWKQAVHLTEFLKTIDADDPCKFDFALFGLGAEERVKHKKN